jgi:hypothetical protein
MFRLGAIAAGVYEQNYGWMDVWDLNPEAMRSLCLKVSATWGGGDLTEN